MQLNLTGHHVDVTPAMRDYVEEKLQKLQRHFEHVTGIHCILTFEKLRHKAEARVALSGGQLFADAVEDDMYAAVDSLVDKLDRQIIRHKEKITDHHARHANKRS